MYPFYENWGKKWSGELLSIGPWHVWQCHSTSFVFTAGMKAQFFLLPMSPCRHVQLDHPVSIQSHITSIAENCRYSPFASNPFKIPTLWNFNTLLYLVFELPFSHHQNVLITIHLLFQRFTVNYASVNCARLIVHWAQIHKQSSALTQLGGGLSW